MLTLLKIWAFIKKYWQVFLVIVGFIVFELLLHRQSTDFAKQLEDIQKRHEKELEDIQRAHDQEEKEHQEAEARMEAALAAIEKQYEQAQKELDESKKAEIKQILIDSKDNPEELAKKLSEVTGFTVILPQDPTP